MLLRTKRSSPGQSCLFQLCKLRENWLTKFAISTQCTFSSFCSARITEVHHQLLDAQEYLSFWAHHPVWSSLSWGKADRKREFHAFSHLPASEKIPRAPLFNSDLRKGIWGPKGILRSTCSVTHLLPQSLLVLPPTSLGCARHGSCTGDRAVKTWQSSLPLWDFYPMGGDRQWPW